jgi:hypothetical protein
MRPILLFLLVGLAIPQLAWPVPKETEAGSNLTQQPATPAYVQRVQPAIVGIGVRVPLDRPSRWDRSGGGAGSS